MPPANPNDPREAVQWKQPAVLLIDCDETRRSERAASMRRAGMVVDCASSGASAEALWQPDKYQLVLVELFEAEIDVRPFCERLHSLPRRQKIGIYRTTPPFIVHLGQDGLAAIAAAEPPRAVRDGSQEALIAATRSEDGKLGSDPKSGLVEASQRIAALRRRTPIYERPAAPAPQERPKPESNASIAARVLGGE
jgi:CheY-like chemotaxis protein